MCEEGGLMLGRYVCVRVGVCVCEESVFVRMWCHQIVGCVWPSNTMQFAVLYYITQH